MSSRSRLARVVRNAPTTAAVLRRHLGRTSAHGASVLLRAAPAGVRRGAVRPGVVRPGVVGRRAPALAALALHADGQAGAATELLRQALAGPAPVSARTTRAVARAAMVMHEPDVAREALGRLDEQDPHRARLLALVLAEQGHLGRALVTVGGSSGRADRRVAARLRGEIEVLQHHELDRVLGGPDATAATGVQATGGAPVGEALHVVTNALPEVQAGYTIRTQGIAAAQRAAGVNAHVVTRYGFPVDIGRVDAAADISLDGVPYHRLLPPPGRALPLPGTRAQRQAADGLARLAAGLGSQLLHAHSRHENGQVALLAGARLGLPVVYEARGFLEESWRTRGGSPDTDFYRWSRDAETTCMAQAALVLTLAETMRAEIVQRGVPADRVHVIPNAVGPRFCDPLPDRAAARRRLGIGEQDTVFGTVTTVNDYEGLDLLVQALTELDDPGARLLLVGDGPARARLAQLAAALGDRVLLTGRVPHARVREHLAAMDVFCVPRRATPVTVLVPPLKPLEAMASGLPVLASDLPPLVEQIQPGRFGLVAPAEDASAWAEQMAVLRYARADAEAMGAAARVWVRQHRTWAAAAARVGAAYARAVDA